MKKKEGTPLHLHLIDLTEWISSEEAVQLISEASGRAIGYRYLRMLSTPKYGEKIRALKIGPNKVLYNRHDAQSYRVSTVHGRKKTTGKDDHNHALSNRRTATT